MNIGKEVKEIEFEDPRATPAPAEPAVAPAVAPVEPVTVPTEEPVGV